MRYWPSTYSAAALGEKSEAVAGGTLSPTGRYPSTRWKVCTRWLDVLPAEEEVASGAEPQGQVHLARGVPVKLFQSSVPSDPCVWKKAGTPQGERLE